VGGWVGEGASRRGHGQTGQRCSAYLPAKQAKRLVGPGAHLEPGKLDGIEDHVHRDLVGKPAHAACEERDREVLPPVAAEAAVRCQQHHQQRVAFAAVPQVAGGREERQRDARELQERCDRAGTTEPSRRH